MNTMADVEAFLGQRRVAIVGASRDPRALSRLLLEELRQRRYDAVPVNPSADELGGARCYASVAEIDPPADAALVMTPAAVAADVVDACAGAGIRHVWLYGGPGGSSVSQAAVDRARAAGMRLVVGHCPYMFLADTPFQHRLHGAIKRLTGSYPKAEAAR